MIDEEIQQHATDPDADGTILPGPIRRFARDAARGQKLMRLGDQVPADVNQTAAGRCRPFIAIKVSRIVQMTLLAP
jgi:hypothetical protein